MKVNIIVCMMHILLPKESKKGGRIFLGTFNFTISTQLNLPLE